MDDCNHLLVSQIPLEVMFWVIIFYFIDIMINDSIWSTLLSDPTLLIFFFTTNYPIIKSNWSDQL